MWKMKTSPRTLKATEKYISSLGRKREEMTEEQWNLMVHYVESRRIAIPFLVIAGLFCAGFAFAYWHLGHKYYTKAIPQNSVTISFDNKKEQISLTSEEIRQYFDYVIDGYMNAGVQVMLAFQLLGFAVLSLTLVRISNRKMHRILFSRPATEGAV